MVTAIIISLAYTTGYLLSFAMIRVEHESEGEVYTKGDRVLAFVMPMLSWGTVIYMLIAAWVGKISKTGYWNKPVKDVTNEPVKVAKK